MKVDSLELKGYRNFDSEKIEFNDGINIICGENAQGKTNILESICLISRGKSWRTRHDSELINYNFDNANIVGCLQSRNRENIVELKLERERRKKIIINGVAGKITELSNYLKTVVFNPDDLSLVKEGANKRRKFIDNAICQLRPNYEKYLSEYENLLVQKTKILKEWESGKDFARILPEFESRMCIIGAHIIRYRAFFCEKLKSDAKLINKDISGERDQLELKYKTVSCIKNPFASIKEISIDLMNHVNEHRNAEIATKTCLSGPHKDDLEVFLNSHSIRSYGSQGQLRTAAITLKLAELNLIKEETEDSPVLLLDDVLSELDSKRAQFVISNIGNIQVIITCCNSSLPEKLGKKIFVSNGKITEG